MSQLRKFGFLAATILIASLYSIALHAQEEAAWQIRYGELSRQTPDAADHRLAADIEAIARKKPDDDAFRIAAGSDAALDNFHEVVRLHFSDAEGEHVCTGVLLSTDAILTAGHCGCGYDYRAEIQNRPVEGDAIPGVISFVPLKVSSGPVPFPGYDCRRAGQTQIGRDLALLRIVPFTYAKPFATFPVAGEEWTILLDFPVIRSTAQVLSQADLHSLYIVGFGKTESGFLAHNLQGANVGVISRQCRRGRVFASPCAMFRELALGRAPTDTGSKPVDSCGGDSGGPAYRMDSNAELDGNPGEAPGTIIKASHRTLVGLVSRALNGVPHPYPGYCGGGGIYTAVGTRPVLDWLRSQHVNFAFDPSPIFQPDAG